MTRENKEYFVEQQYRTNPLSHLYAPNVVSIDKGEFDVIYDNIHFPEAYMRQVNQNAISLNNYESDSDDFDIAEDYYGAPSGLTESEKEAWIEANEMDWD